MAFDNNILQTWQNMGDLESKYFFRNKKKNKIKKTISSHCHASPCHDCHCLAGCDQEDCEAFPVCGAR